MELHLPDSVSVKIRSGNGLIRVVRSSPDGTNIYLIEQERLYELIDGRRIELRTDAYDYKGLDGLIQTLGLLIQFEGGTATEVLYEAIFYDLMAGKPLSWLPPGYYYFEDSFGAVFTVFPTREDLEKFLRDETEDDVDEIECREYYFTGCDHEDFDLRTEFQRELF